ncbi:MAG: TonB-dependent receptor [Ignavibacteriales bacterium]|nr:TonB-dependent receptor [Ignavibacteriales bacterium]
MGHGLLWAVVMCLFAGGVRAGAQMQVDSLALRSSLQAVSTNTIRVFSQQNMRNLPLRGILPIVGLSNGINRYADGWHVRGGRANEIRFFLDGFDITNPATLGMHVPLIQEMVEEARLEPGGFGVERGPANSALLSVATRTGDSRLRASLDVQTDDFAKPGKTFLGTTAFGYRNIVGTLSGPLLTPAIRIFLAGEHNYIRDRQIIFLEPFKIDGLVDEGVYSSSLRGVPLPGPIEILRNHVPNNWREQNQVSGTLLVDLKDIASLPMVMKFAAGYSHSRQPEGSSWGDSFTNGLLRNYYRGSHLMMSELSTWFITGKLTHTLSPSTRYELGISYQFSKSRTYDPSFGDDWASYPDSLEWEAKGFSTALWRSRYSGPPEWGTRMMYFRAENWPNDRYSKGENGALGITLDLSSSVSKDIEVRIGGHLSSWTHRLFDLQYISYYLTGPVYSAQYRPPANEYERRLLYLASLVGGNYGYDYLGRKTDGYTLDGAPAGAVLDPPYKSLNGGAYLQVSYVSGGVAFDIGGRYEFFDEGLKYIEPVPNPLTGQPDYRNIWINQRLNIIDESKIENTRPVGLLLPRLGFSVAASENTTFYAHYGEYAQFPRLDLFYQGSAGFSAGLSPNSRSPYAGKFGFFVQPERTMNIDCGISQRLTDNMVLTTAVYYKELKQQIQISRYYDSMGEGVFTAFMNRDYGSTKGLEFTLEVARTRRVSARANYTLANSTMTEWSPTSGSVTVSDVNARYPKSTYLPPFNFAHTATVNLDYRIEKGEIGGVFEGVGLNVLLSFNGGHAYTRIEAMTTQGSASVWSAGVRPLVDARMSKPQEAPGSSTTPMMCNVDLRCSKLLFLDPITLEFYVNVLNLFNTKNVINVYPMTGRADEDGWLGSEPSRYYESRIPDYRNIYDAFGNGNRYYVIGTGVGDTYGEPRQIRVGFRLEY